jgi:O-antigen/teichoic acid export membrane protein
VSRDGLEYRAARVSLVTGLSTIMSIAFQLISVPICLMYWGDATYGSWLVLYAAFILIRSLDTGFVCYVGNKLNYLFHQDQIALREHLASALAGIAIIGAVQLLLGVAALSSDGIASLLGMPSGPSPDHRSRVALLVLLGTWVLSGSYLGLVHRLLIPAGMMYQAAWWSMGFQVSQVAGILLAAMLHYDMLHTALLFAGIQFSLYLASAIYIRQSLPEYYPWWRSGRVRTGLSDLGHSMWLTATNIIQQSSFNGTVILIATLSGPAAVPIFTTARTLANLWTNVSNVLITPLLPDIVRYHATGKGLKTVAINEAYWVLVGTTVNLGVLMTYPFIGPLYGYWTAHAVSLDKSLLCLLLSGVVVANVGGFITMYLNGVNSLRVLLAASVVRSIFVLGVGGMLSIRLGLAGFGIGLFGGELVVLFMMGRYFMARVLSRQGVSLSLRSLAPITVSTTSVLLFLLSDGLSLAQHLYPIALLTVAATALWGWRGLEVDVRTRLLRMTCKRFTR